MKKYIICMAALALLVSCTGKKSTRIDRSLAQYAVVNIETPDLSGITENGKEVLNLYRFAADEADKIYWKQYFGDKAEMEAISDPATREYAMINYGPWDRLTGESFVEGWSTRPYGAGFYPADMSEEEFLAFDDPAKLSPYTMIRRNASDSLEAVWFHDAYKEEIEKIASYLNAAADLTIKPSVREYLLKKIDALRTDDYYASEIAWLDMDDSKMDLIIGPDEVKDDLFFGIKASYAAYVLLKDLDRTEQLRKYVALLPELQKSLPCDDAYKAFTPGIGSNIFSCNAIYYSGNANAGIKDIALNLPFDPKVQAERGTRIILLRNVMNEKFNRVVRPTASVLLGDGLSQHVDDEAFFWLIAFREAAHGLGVTQTINGKGSIAQALGSSAQTWEEAKGIVLGAYLAGQLCRQHQLSGIFTREDVVATFVASLMRSQRYGLDQALGRANTMCLNYLRDNGAVSRKPDGKYSINFSKAEELIAELGGLILQIQATGDRDAAGEFENRYASPKADYAEDVFNLGLANVPTDLRFVFKK